MPKPKPKPKPDRAAKFTWKPEDVVVDSKPPKPKK